MAGRTYLTLVFLLSLLSQADPPSSRRSREVVGRVAPLLRASLQEQGLVLGQPIFIRIFKESDELEVWMQPGPERPFQHFKTYEISNYGGQGIGPKLREGDGVAPEGFYFVTPAQLNPYSRYHLSFNLGYPNRYDRMLARTGSALMVHGRTASIGCYAMTDPQIEEIYTVAEMALRNGQPYFRVHIFPARLTTEQLEVYRTATDPDVQQWYPFWQNLAEGYRYFQEHGFPPNVTVDAEEQLYRFEP